MDFFDRFRIKKCGETILMPGITKCEESYYKVRILQCVTDFITKCVSITKCDSHFKAKRNKINLLTNSKKNR